MLKVSKYQANAIIATFVVDDEADYIVSGKIGSVWCNRAQKFCKISVDNRHNCFFEISDKKYRSMLFRAAIF